MNVNVLFLCGGQGTRLRPLTDKLAKPLISISESETIISRLLIQFQPFFQCRNIWINVSTHATSFLTEMTKVEFKIRPNILYETKLLGAASTLLEFSKLVHGPALVIHGDLVLSNAYVKELLLRIEGENRNLVFCHFRSANQARSCITRDQNYLVTELINGGENIEATGSVLVNSGVYFFPDVRQLEFNSGYGQEIADTVLLNLIRQQSLYAIDISLERISVDSMEKLNEAKFLVSNEKVFREH